jgi:phospholipase/lecithinase/hemolysin
MAIDFRRIVFFGDSLTDDGNLPEPFRPDPPYVGGRFSNGPVYAEILTRELTVRSDNMALGGAEASTNGTDDLPQHLIGLSAQVDRYFLQEDPFSFLQSDPSVEPGTAASIFIGSNDFLNEPPASRVEAAHLVQRVVSSIGDAVVELVSAGVGHVVLFTLPDVFDAPKYQNVSAEERASMEAAIASANRGIKAIAAQSSSVVEVSVVELNRLEAEVRADRETFGLKVLETPLYEKIGSRLVATGIGAQYSADEVAFFDPVHLTTAAHALIAAFAEATLRADQVVLRGGTSDIVVDSARSDFILSGRGNDRVSGRSGDDVLFTGTGNDCVDAGDGNDLAVGGSGTDVIRGKAGTDLIAGNAGADWLSGGTGSDVIVDGTGGDQMFGESGHDVFIFTNDGLGNGFDQIAGGSGIDTLRLSVSSSFHDSLAFKSDLQEFAEALRAAPGSTFTFDSLDLAVSRVERIEVIVGGKPVYAAGHVVVTPNPAMASLLHDADLWGLV